MKRALIILISGLVSLSFVSEQPYRSIPNNSFNKGEFLEYRVHYGFITAGKGTMEVSNKLYRINDRICYKIDTKGRTVGSFKYFMRVNDLWRSYIDTSAFVSQKFYRHIEENNYRKDEEVFYDHQANNVRVVDKKRKIDKKYNVPDNAQDMISGYYFLRTVDFSKLNSGDTLTVPGFLEEESYELKLVYRGKGVVRNRLGKINVLKLTPIMPENSFFDGENSLRVWVSDDVNKIPVKVEADMFIGAVEIDLDQYSGLKGDLNLVK